MAARRPRLTPNEAKSRSGAAQRSTAEAATRPLARHGALAAALQLSHQMEDAVIVTIACDRGDRYLSTGVFPE